MRVVFLHAFPLNGRMWDNVRTADSVAPDLYDLGSTMTAWAHRVLAAAGPGRLVLVGCSMGASCALEMVRVAPDRVAGLVLVGGKAGVRHEPAVRDRYVDLIRSAGVEAFLDQATPRFLGPSSDQSRARALALAKQQSADQLIRGIGAFHNRPDASAVLASYRGLVRIMRGQHDGVGRHRRADPRTTEVAGAGHYVNLDQPDALRGVLLDTLRALD